MKSKISVAEANAFLEKAFTGRSTDTVVEVADGRALVRLETGPEHQRPGGFISGPTQMAVADNAAYMAVFTKLGITCPWP